MHGVRQPHPAPIRCCSSTAGAVPFPAPLGLGTSPPNSSLWGSDHLPLLLYLWDRAGGGSVPLRRDELLLEVLVEQSWWWVRPPALPPQLALGSGHHWTPGHEPRAKALPGTPVGYPPGKQLLTEPASWKQECFKGGSVRATKPASEELPSALPAPPALCEGWRAAWRSRRRAGRYLGAAVGIQGWVVWQRMARSSWSDGVVSRCCVQVWSCWGWVCVEKEESQHIPSTSYLLQVLCACTVCPCCPPAHPITAPRGPGIPR